MGLLDDISIFAAIIQQGGFSHAAKYLGLSNGLISRRIVQLETRLGITLIKRTTRQIKLTPEGELFWQHAQRIQQELDSAVSLIQESAKKPKGIIRVSAPVYFGQHYLTPIIIKFMLAFPDINIDLNLSNQTLDPIKNKLDLVIRGAGYLGRKVLKDSNLQVKQLLHEKINLYASPAFLQKYGTPTNPEDLPRYAAVCYSTEKNKLVAPKGCFISNDIESNLLACIEGAGIGKFTDLNVKIALSQKKLMPVLINHDWGDYYLYAAYPQQKSLPHRTRLLLDFICEQVRHLTRG